MHTRQRDIPLPVAGQVTSLELFFDLVFVFTITQLTATVLPGGWAVTGRTVCCSCCCGGCTAATPG